MIIRNIIQSINLNVKNARYSSTKLAYVSDLHLERAKWETYFPRINRLQIKQMESEKIHGVAILGDLSNPLYDNFKYFLGYLGGMFDNVYFIAGNHEYYTKSIDISKLKELIDYRILNSIEKAKYISSNNSIYYLNNSLVTVPNNKLILGSTLWSDQTKSLEINNNAYYSKFYKFIIDEHTLAVEYIEKQLENIKEFNKINEINEPNVTVLTHYLPTYNLIHEDYKKIYYINRHQSERYFSNLDFFLDYPVKNWVCGHSHCVMDKNINNVYCGINSYVSQNTYELNLKFIEL